MHKFPSYKKYWLVKLLLITSCFLSIPSIFADDVIDPVEQEYLAPPLEDISAWFNTKPINLSDLKGHVILVDFWTYSCINCVRTIPFLNMLYQKYHQQGLEIVGVHSPEFDFEKDPQNVQRAIQKYSIRFPIVLDNHYETWQNYANQFWPADYLIDKTGHVVYQHFGEGDYQVIENNIRVLLGMGSELLVMHQEEEEKGVTPETYLGYARATRMMTNPAVHDVESQYLLPRQLHLDQWGLQGPWIIHSDFIESTKANAKIALHFSAGKVYAILGPHAKKAVTVSVLLNGKPISNASGKQVFTVDHFDLYELAHFPKVQQGIITLIVDGAVDAYTFSFGE